MCHLNPIGTITGTMMEHSHYRPIHIPAGGSGGRGVGGGGGFLAVFCGRSDGGEEYDFIIKIACTVSSFYFYM